jgi:pilus assembly protein CpaB
MKDGIVPVASVAVGLAAFFLTTQYWRSKEADIREQERRLKAAQEQVTVMVAARNIPRGTALVKSDLAPRAFYRSDIVSDAMNPQDALRALGKKTIYGLAPGDQLTWSNIEGGHPAAAGLAQTIKPGLRAISVSVSGSAAVSGMVRPNDRVDVLGTFTFPSAQAAGEMETVTLTVLQDVLVLATGQNMARQTTLDTRRGDASYSAVTLEVSTSEAELLVFAQQARGRLTLALRHPEDVQYNEKIPVVNFDHLQNKLEEYNQRRQHNILNKTRRPGSR